MKIAIIGAGGFIGKKLVSVLSKNPLHQLKLFGRSQISSFDPMYQYASTDLLDIENLTVQLRDIEYVYYLASSTIPASSWHDPGLEVSSNLVPFLNFLKAVDKNQIPKVCFISSGGTVYGAGHEAFSEEHDKNPYSPYGITKLAMEQYLVYYNHKTNLQYDVFRISNVYGYGQNTVKGLGLINVLLEKIIARDKIHIYGNGENVRNYVFIDDVAEILAKATEFDADQSNILNLASNDTLSINQILGIMQIIVDEELFVEYEPGRASDYPTIDLCNSKLKSVLPSFRFTDIKEGINKTYIDLKQAVW